MSRKKGKTARDAKLNPRTPPSRRRSLLANFGIVVALLALSASGWRIATHWRLPNESTDRREVAYHSRPPGTLTFTRDVAPIVFKNCSGCHRPNQSAPFSLITYADIKKRLHEVADVTSRQYMPPWQPQRGYGEFADERHLSNDELGVLQQWISEGANEGRREDLPPLPNWDPTWRLGKPDLVVETQPFNLGPEGKDLYHNFVVPIPTETLRYVRGVEFRPGNAKVVHHAFVQVDETRKSRQLAEKQNPPGFDGMETPETAVMPGGQLLGFQPGKTPSFSPEGLAWILKTNTDLVLQVHMNRSGKPETVQPSVAFYFTDRAPTNRCFRLKLTSFQLDIPPGATNYQTRQSYTLPVDASVLRISAHAHYLGKSLRGYALLPSGERRELIWIKDWDFKWQGDYGYARPVWFPKGSTLNLDYTYDNSTNNIRNPHSPPERVRWGLQSSDEMGELTLQLLPENEADWKILANDYANYFLGVSQDFYRFRIGLNPDDGDAHKRLGRILGFRGKYDEATGHLTQAIRLDPKADEPHFDLGNIYLQQNRITDAYEEFRTVARMNPNDSEAFGSLGLIAYRSGKTQIAKAFFERALLLDPADARARQYLDAIQTGPK
jgi:tetratricopeptide (TPR) repeat protein